MEECPEWHLSNQGEGDLRIPSWASLKHLSHRGKEEDMFAFYQALCLLGET